MPPSHSDTTMPPAIDVPVAQAYATLLHEPTPSGTPVARAAIDALLTAYGIEDPAHIAEPAGAFEPTTDTHTAVAAALYAGTADLRAVAAELTVHALRSHPRSARHVLGALTTALRTSASAVERATLEAALDELADEHPMRAWFARELAQLYISTSEPGEAIARICRRAFAEPVAADDARPTAQLACVAFLHVTVSEREWLRDRAMQLDPDGWGLEIELMSIPNAEGERTPELLDGARQLSRRAAATGDPMLAVRNLTNRGWFEQAHGDFAAAEAWLQRALVEARTAANIRYEAHLIKMLVWLLIADLRLAAATKLMHRLIELVESEGLIADRQLTLFMASNVAHHRGDRSLLDRWVTETGWTEGREIVEWAVEGSVGQRREYLEWLTLDMLASFNDPRAAAALRAIREREHSEIGKEATLAYIEARLDPSGESWRRFPDLVGGRDPTEAAEIISWLARHVALDGVEQARGALADVLTATEPAAGSAPIIDLARSECTAALNADWHALVAIADQWEQGGFQRASALARASAAACAARADEGEQAQRWFDDAHHELAQLGLVVELDRVRRARDRCSSSSAWRAGLTSQSLLDVLDLGHRGRAITRDFVVRRVVPKGSQFPDGFVSAIVSGIATLDRGDRSRPVDVVGPGEVVHAERVLDEVDTSVRAYALTPCVIDTVPVAAMVAETTRSASMAIAIGRWSLARTHRELARAWRIAHDPLEQRVAAVLVDLAARVGIEREDGACEIHVPRQTLAPLAGATREATSRSMSALVRDEVLDASGRAIVVRDLPALRARAEA